MHKQPLPGVWRLRAGRETKSKHGGRRRGWGRAQTASRRGLNMVARPTSWVFAHYDYLSLPPPLVSIPATQRRPPWTQSAPQNALIQLPVPFTSLPRLKPPTSHPNSN
ncbi:hypothetical protein AB1N83_013932 [Pleurotus pulmonarius]